MPLQCPSCYMYTSFYEDGQIRCIREECGTVVVGSDVYVMPDGTVMMSGPMIVKKAKRR